MNSFVRYSFTSETDTSDSNASNISKISIEGTPKRVQFGTVTIREYSMTLGDNPATRIGAPVCLSWEYFEHPPLPLDDPQLHPSNKNSKHKKKSPADFYMNYYKRLAIIERAGFSKDDFDRAEKAISWQRVKRKLSEYQSYPILWLKSWKVDYGRRKSRRFVEKYRRKHGMEHSKKKPPTIHA